MILATWSSMTLEKLEKVGVRTSGPICGGSTVLDTGKVEQILFFFW